MFIIESNFIGNFKVGDNINYNLGVLSRLYEAQQNSPENDKAAFVKPILIINAAIIEAILDDFLNTRIKGYVREKIQSMSRHTIRYIQGKEISKLDNFIDQAKKHNFFDQDDNKLYDDLKKLAGYRNRIHIQNDQQKLPLDEVELFTLEIQIKSESIVELIMRKMLEKYSRPAHARCVEEFTLPWEPYHT